MKYNVERLKNFVVSDTGFLFDPTTGEIFSTNAVGASIIKALQEEEMNIDEIRARVLAEFEVSESVADKDIREFIPVLVNLGLIGLE